nr:MAG TPA: hypothetical protein [Caudoviricetes sp.]
MSKRAHHHIIYIKGPALRHKGGPMSKCLTCNNLLLSIAPLRQ